MFGNDPVLNKGNSKWTVNSPMGMKNRSMGGGIEIIDEVSEQNQRSDFRIQENQNMNRTPTFKKQHQNTIASHHSI